MAEEQLAATLLLNFRLCLGTGGRSEVLVTRIENTALPAAKNNFFKLLLAVVANARFDLQPSQRKRKQKKKNKIGSKGKNEKKKKKTDKKKISSRAFLTDSPRDGMFAARY